MEKTDRELLIKEISSRLPYGIKAQVLGWNEEKGEIKVPLKVYSIDTDGCVYFESNGYDVDYVDVESCLLYLRPMSSIAELITAKEWSSLGGIELIDWYNANHIDYRGLIDKGLALEAPEGMYNLND